VICAALSVAGWVLAGTGLLGRAGYGVMLGIGLVAWIGCARKVPVRLPAFRLRRWKRFLPAAFAAVLVLSFVGGAIHLPSNYDALSYRTPQLLHWIDTGRWHWIDTPNSRMNIAPPGYNWLAAPLLLFTGTDRWTFLPNIAAFAFFPGFLFELFRRAGVSRRAAWWWMWLVPLGYVFVTQAGGVGNDMIGAVFAAAAFALGLRARKTMRVRDAGLSMMAVAFCTGIKNVNLPIVLPWLIAVWPVWRLALSRPGAFLSFAAVSLAASCFPTTMLNWQYTGHYTGDPHDEHRVRQPDPVSGVISNAVVLLVANTQPPIWPAANAVNERIAGVLDASPIAEACRKSPRFEARWYEMPSEEHAGLGPGICALLVVSALFGGLRRRARESRVRRRWDVAIAGGMALLVPVALMSTDGLPRLISPLLVPALLLVLLPAANEVLPRARWWRVCARIVALLSFPALLLSPARPLLPMRTLLARLADSHPGSAALARAARVYRIYDERADAFAPVKELLPADVRNVWMITFGDEPETSLWRPFGSRSIRHMITLPERIAPGSAVVASESILQERFGMSAEEFADRFGLTIAGSTELDLRASGAPSRWWVLLSARK
jgi:hypothetical protein